MGKKVEQLLEQLSNKNENTELENFMLQLHIAEYSALTNRCTNFMAIQYVLFGAFLTIFGILLGQWNVTNAVLSIWMLLGSIQIYAFLHFIVWAEQEHATFYIENHLRAKINKLRKENDFWKYETYLTKNRSKADLNVDWLWLPLDLIVIGYFTYLRIIDKAPWDRIDLIGSSITVCFFFLALWKSNQALILKRKTHSKEGSFSIKS